ncbi:MAG TPA: helix-turn-helix transcriptional regulator [Gammaproteobacteria bacterium]
MAQTGELIKTLKQALKTHGKTYADVAGALDLSEASVKRLFSQQNFSLERLDRICQLIGLEISDLVQLMTGQQHELKQLTVEQEQQLVEDNALLVVAICALNRWKFEDIVAFYDMTEGECFLKLAALDRMKLIELLPKNRIRVRAAPNFSWLPNGPIQGFFQESIGQDFLQGRFSQKNESLIVLNGMLSPESNAEFQRKLRRLAWEFNLLNNDDAALPLEKRDGTLVVLAMRRWQYGALYPLRKRG